MAQQRSKETPHTTQGVRLSQVSLQGYKSIESLTLELPSPKTADDIDAFVLGSKNGVGKSSILEACAIGLVNAIFPALTEHARMARSREFFNPYDLLIRSGSSSAVILSKVQFDEKIYSSEVVITREGIDSKQAKNPLSKAFSRRGVEDQRFFPYEEWLTRVLGLNNEPFVIAPVLMFHSYRKVVEGNSALGAMVDPELIRRRNFSMGRYMESGPLSTFKVVLVRALMARSGLFEGIERHTDDILEKLNGLMRDFAQGRVDKLRPGPDGTLELRVAPINGSDSYSFDGLSSGQKEIIATLFLIWYTTRDCPGVVLIDEPELHLNAEWQRLFVRTLGSLAPKNQYIMATHSEEIFGSVPPERRLMLQRG